MSEGVRVKAEDVIRALHERYGRTIGELHQEVAELLASNRALVSERDEARESAVNLAAATEVPERGQPIAGVFRQDGRAPVPIEIPEVTNTFAD